MVNEVILVGNLTKDVELKTFSSGSKVGKTTIAVNNPRTKAKDDTEFIDIAGWDKLGEIMEQFGKKGTQVLVRGRIHTSSYEKDGVKRKSFEIVLDQFQVLGRKAASATDAAAPAESAEEAGLFN